MKKKYYLLSLALVVLAVACTPEEENLFDKSSAKRADAAIETTIEILTNTSNGWVMQYFPSSTQKFGGYNLILSFDKKGIVNVAGELTGPTEIASSLYTVKQSAGIVLSFDSYNPIFHYFSDPSNPSGLGGMGKGLEGDYDFFIMESSAKKIVLKGKKTGSIATMTPLDGDWSSYITDILTIKEDMKFDKINLVLDGEEIPVSFINNKMVFTYKNGSENKSQEVPFVVTKTGYKFYSPVEIKGIKLHGFNYDPKNNWFAETENNSAKLIPAIIPLNQLFMNGRWYIALSTSGEIAKPNFIKCKQIMEKYRERLEYAYFGKTIYDSFGFNMRTVQITGVLGYNCELDGNNKVKLQFNRLGDNGIHLYTDRGVDTLLSPFGTDSERTFTLTTDNEYKPTIIILTEDANPKNIITLHKQRILYPFDN